MATVAPQQVRLTSKHSHIGENRQAHSHDGFVTFDVGSQYKVLETIGSGSYGVVCSAIDIKTGKQSGFGMLTTCKIRS